VYKRINALARSIGVSIEQLHVEERLPRRLDEELRGPVEDLSCDARAMRVSRRPVIRNPVWVTRRKRRQEWSPLRQGIRLRRREWSRRQEWSKVGRRFRAIQ